MHPHSWVLWEGCWTNGARVDLYLFTVGNEWSLCLVSTVAMALRPAWPADVCWLGVRFPRVIDCGVPSLSRRIRRSLRAHARAYRQKYMAYLFPSSFVVNAVIVCRVYYIANSAVFVCGLLQCKAGVQSYVICQWAALSMTMESWRTFKRLVSLSMRVRCRFKGMDFFLPLFEDLWVVIG